MAALRQELDKEAVVEPEESHQLQNIPNGQDGFMDEFLKSALADHEREIALSLNGFDSDKNQ